MQDEVLVVEAVLAGTASPLEVEVEALGAAAHRLIGALQAGNAGPAELAALVRHFLRQESERQSGMPQTFRIAPNHPWPAHEVWEKHGVCWEEHPAGYGLATALPWQPDWLDTERVSPEAEAFRAAPRRELPAVAGDPFLEILGEKGYPTYLCEGQKQAVRAVLTAPPGATLVVNLPTGHGKSLCAHLPGLLPGAYGHAPGATIVVVPTVALCLDQARSLRRHVGDVETAYYSGTSAEAREQIRARLRAGTQPVLFTSPESLVGSLKASVFDASRDGFVRALVIDEAHIVSHWGDGFRPQFQELAGMRAALLELCPPEKRFRTALLSATITAASLETLATLFGKPGPFRMVSAVQLRPEPSFWARFCENSALREERVLEAVRHLPRPLILYTTEVAEAEAWAWRLRDAGYRHRASVMTGKTPNSERERIIERWRDRDLDLVVATAAFGLGVDQQDVRAVVHACVPETVDRFYQEVGRSGRDGRASLSLVLYTAQDFRTAHGLQKKRLISQELGLDRWRQMFEHAAKDALGEGRFRVRAGVGRTLDMQGKRNTAWNLRTLTLMARAGLIELGDEPPRFRRDDDSLDDGPDVETRVIRPLLPDHLDPACWQECVEGLRQHSAGAQYELLRLMNRLLRQKRCVSDILAQAYHLDAASLPGQPTSVPVARSCGGCGFCRNAGRERFTHAPFCPRFPWEAQTAIGPELSSCLGPRSLLGIYYSGLLAGKERVREWQRVADWTISQGIRLLVGPPELLEDRSPQFAASLRATPVFYEQEYDRHRLPRVPALVVGSPVTNPSLVATWLQAAQHPETLWAPHILLFLEDLVDPSRSDRLVRTLLYPCLSLDEWKQRDTYECV